MHVIIKSKGVLYMETLPTASNIPTKVTVKIKTEDATIREDFLIYDAYTVDYNDSVLNEVVNMTASKYKGTLADADITITTKLTWQKMPERGEYT
jgi:hypothetical protein